MSQMVTIRQAAKLARLPLRTAYRYASLGYFGKPVKMPTRRVPASGVRKFARLNGAK